MNEAGRSAGPARGSFKLDLDRVLVLHDEIDLPFGEIRTRLGGGLAGHNGLKSLKRELGSPDFHRVPDRRRAPGLDRPGHRRRLRARALAAAHAEVADLIGRAADEAERSSPESGRQVTSGGQVAKRREMDERSDDDLLAATRPSPRRSRSSTAATSARCSRTSRAAPATRSSPPT